MSFKLDSVDFRVQFSTTGDGGIVAMADFPSGKEEWSVPRQSFLEASLSDLPVRLRLGQLQKADLQAAGSRLFDLLIPPPVQPLFIQARQFAPGARLRLYLETNAPEVAALPWELAYDHRRRLFLALDAGFSLIRLWPQEQLERLLPPNMLRILAVFSSPMDMAVIPADEEHARLREALANRIERGQVELHVLETPRTPQKLQQALASGAYNVFLFLGHGALTPAGGRLFLEDDERHSRPIDADQLRLLLRGTGLRLAVLLAGESATVAQAAGGPTPAADALLSALAPALVADGLPAVVALQGDMRTRTVLALNAALFQGLADRLSVDAALQHARQRVFYEGGDDWAAPVLYTRGKLDDQLLCFDDAPRPQEMDAGVGAMSNVSQQAISNVGGTISGDLYDLDSKTLNVRQKVSRVGGSVTGAHVDLFGGSEAGAEVDAPQTAEESAEREVAPPVPSQADLEALLGKLREAVVGDVALKPLEKVRAIAAVEELAVAFGSADVSGDRRVRLLQDVGQANAETKALAAKIGHLSGLDLGG